VREFRVERKKKKKKNAKGDEDDDGKKLIVFQAERAVCSVVLFLYTSRQKSLFFFFFFFYVNPVRSGNNRSKIAQQLRPWRQQRHPSYFSFLPFGLLFITHSFFDFRHIPTEEDSRGEKRYQQQRQQQQRRRLLPTFLVGYSN
jgi:hypothetical protein